jgi:hypothetical protein
VHEVHIRGALYSFQVHFAKVEKPLSGPPHFIPLIENYLAPIFYLSLVKGIVWN